MAYKKKFEEALSILEKIILERDHMPECPHYKGEPCVCMDRRVYDKEKIYEEVCIFVSNNQKKKN